ncbi:MAG: HPF/RaiA family ribosome-associated protein [Candidatus Dependentiae bacterium]
MNKKITFRHMEHSQVLDDYANGQLARIISFLENEPSPVYVELTFTPSKVHAHHHVELLVSSPNYDEFYSYTGPDFYDVVDKVIDGMYRKLLEAKDKRVEDRKMVGRHEEFKKQR